MIPMIKENPKEQQTVVDCLFLKAVALFRLNKVTEAAEALF